MTYSMPKWYLLRNKIAHTIGEDSEVQVSDLIEGNKIGTYKIEILTENKDKGCALNTLMKSKHVIDNIIIDIKVRNKAGDLYKSCDVSSRQAILKIIEDAFQNNTLYVKTVISDKKKRNAVYPVFKPVIIQFFNDDICDYYNNFNSYPAQILRELLNVNIIGIPLLISTDKL